MPVIPPAVPPAAPYAPPRRLLGLSPFGPLLGKELRQMARRKRTYVLRCAYLGLLLILLGFVWLIFTNEFSRGAGVVQQAQRQAQLGQTFFATFAFFTIGFMQVMAPVLTSNAIGAERLARTFDVLVMTPINAWQIVCGKLFSRLMTALTLVGLSLPVLAIVRLLGGVEIDDMIGLIVLAAATATGSAALGLFFSTFIGRAWAVILLSVLVQFAIYVVIPACAGMLLSDIIRTARLYRFVQQLWGAWWPVVACGFNIFEARSAVGWWIPAAVQLGLALLLLIASALMVRRLARGAAGDVRPHAAPPGGFPVMPPPLPGALIEPALPAEPADELPTLAYQPTKIKPSRPARSVGDNPVLWHAVRQPLFARLWQRIVAVVATLGLLALTYVALANENDLDDRGTHAGYAVVFHSVLLLIAVVVSATAMAGEKESDTWTLLIVSPISGWQVVWGKFCGSLRRLLWPWAIVVAHFCVAALTGVVPLAAAMIAVVMSLACNLLWLATGLIFSLRCRRTTAAVVLNLFVPILLYGGVPLVLATTEALFVNDPGFDLTEVAVYHIPYYYEVESVDRFDRANYYGTGSSGRNIRLPFFDEYTSQTSFVLLAMGVTIAYLTLTTTLLAWAALRFDDWAGRAR